MIFVFTFLIFEALSWGQINQPKLGWMVDRIGALRLVSGVTGSVTVGDGVLTGVLSSGCSASLYLVKTGASIVSPTGSVPAPAGPAVFDFDGNAALAYFPWSKQLARWYDNQLDPVNFDVTGEILSVRRLAGVLLFAVRRANGVWVVRDGDISMYALPRATGPVMLLDGGVLYAAAGAVVLRRNDASELRFPLDGAEAFWWLGPGYVQIRTGGSMYALRVDPGREQLFQLPEAAAP